MGRRGKPVRRACRTSRAATWYKRQRTVAGEHDLVAVIRIEGPEQLADIVTKHMLKLEGIEHTKTLVAFKDYRS